MNILHTITGLGVGGAEVMLFRMLMSSDRNRLRPAVLSLMQPGPIGARISALGVSVHSLGMRQEAPSVRSLLNLVKISRVISPVVVHGWMYHGNIAATVAAALLKKKARQRCALLWSVHHTL